MSKVQITAFTGEYYFLSNYCTCPITIDGLTYRSAEAAFQAAKCSDPIDRAAFCTVPPNVAKAIGRKIKLRDGWEKERDGIMADIIHAKFSQNPGFAQALIDTDDAELIEGNTWNDNYWGMCGCTRCRSEGTKGLNKLGKTHKAADTPRYKALGNSIALPQWYYVLGGIADRLPDNATLGSLFDGIGGFPYVWAQLHDGRKELCVWASEIEEFPIAVTKKWFPEVEDGRLF